MLCRDFESERKIHIDETQRDRSVGNQTSLHIGQRGASTLQKRTQGVTDLPVHRRRCNEVGTFGDANQSRALRLARQHSEDGRGINYDKHWWYLYNCTDAVSRWARPRAGVGLVQTVRSATNATNRRPTACRCAAAAGKVSIHRVGWGRPAPSACWASMRVGSSWPPRLPVSQVRQRPSNQFVKSVKLVIRFGPEQQLNCACHLGNVGRWKVGMWRHKEIENLLELRTQKLFTENLKSLLSGK